MNAALALTQILSHPEQRSPRTEALNVLPPAQSGLRPSLAQRSGAGMRDKSYSAPTHHAHTALLLLAGFCLLFGEQAHGAELLARGLSLPTYVTGISQPVAVTRVALMEKDYYRRGFLQFGVLPITVGRDVVMEVRRPEALGAALEGIQGWKKAPGRGQAVELRGFLLRVLLPDGQRELTAGRVRFGEQGQVVLAQGVAWKEAGGVTLEAEEAVLQTTGAHAGRLVLQMTSRPVTRQIFGQTVLPAEAAKSTKQPNN